MKAMELCEALASAKAAEKAARDERVKIELALCEIFECDERASRTHQIEGWKVAVKRPINRKIDAKAWERIKERVPEELRPVEYKPSVSAAGCTWLQENDPETWAVCAEAITESAGKPAVTVTRLEE